MEWKTCTVVVLVSVLHSTVSQEAGKDRELPIRTPGISEGHDVPKGRLEIPIAKGYVNGDGSLSFPIWENGRRVGIKRADGTSILFPARKTSPETISPPSKKEENKKPEGAKTPPVKKRKSIPAKFSKGKKFALLPDVGTLW